MPIHSLRAMFDTNIYELLLDEANANKVRNLVHANSLIVYGCKLIRDELRDTPTYKRIGGENLRIVLLQTYDSLVQARSYPIGIEIEALAKEYLNAYRGGVSRSKILPDFTIIAAATIHRLDIVVSEDDRTMKSGPAKSVYEKINKEKIFQTQRFLKNK